MLTDEEVQAIRKRMDTAWDKLGDTTFRAYAMVDVPALCDTVDELRRCLRVLSETRKFDDVLSVLSEADEAAILAAIGDGDDMKTNHAQPAM